MINILLIEDDEDDILLMKETLEQGNLGLYQLDSRSNYDEALAAINTSSYDILLVDYNLGKKTGLDLMREACVGEKVIPFILLTGVSIQKRDEESLNLGAYDFLVKGEMPPDLVSRSILYALKHASTLRDLKKSERQKYALLEQQFTVQKLQAIGTLVGGVAHDFNNILGGILATSQRFHSKVENNQDLALYGANIIALANRGKDIVSQLLTYARQQETKTAVNDVNLIVHDCLTMVRSITPAMIAISKEIPETANYVHCESSQIHQVITNLVINATQALGHQAGSVTVSVNAVTIDGGYARDSGWLNQRAMFQKIDTRVIDGRIANEMKIGLLDAGEYVRITVQDNGHGIDVDTMSRIMDPFFTTKSSHGGTGLGLATVRGIVSTLKGGLLIRSLPDEYTSFDVFFPTVQETLANAASSEPPILTSGNGRRILLVDDETVLGNMYKEFLDEQGFITDYFPSPIDALQAFTADPHAWDILVTDDSMPNMRGLTLVEAIRKQRTDLPVILWSGRPLTESDALLKTLGVYRVLIKPVSFNDMISVLTELLHPIATQ